jgi:hypothetical protein
MHVLHPSLFESREECVVDFNPCQSKQVGFASTATFRSDGVPRGGDVYAGLEKQVKVGGFATCLFCLHQCSHFCIVKSFDTSKGPLVVVFQDLDSPVRDTL